MLITQKIGDTYNKHALTLQIGDRVSRVTDYILTSYQPDFAVMQGSVPIGIVTREDVLRALATMPHDAFVTEIMRREIHKIDAQATLDQARDEMAEKASRVAAVYNNGQYLGLVSQDDIKEAFAVLAFMQLRQRRAAQPAPDA